MTTAVAKTIEDMIDELHRSAARNIRLSQQRDIRRRQHDSRIYRDRAEADLRAIRHLTEAL